MGKNKTTGLISRLMMGKEKSEEYARGTLPSNRWELFWDIFKGRFGKLIIINLLTALFCIPLILLLFMRNNALSNLGASYPFASTFGLGFMAPDSMVGFAENIVLQVNVLTYLFLPIAVVIMSIGISGAAYVMRNMVWTEGIFVANDFWKGIKENFKRMLVIGLLYSTVFYILTIGIAISDQNIAIGEGPKWLWVLSKILSYLMLALFSIMTMHMVTMTVTYELKFRYLLKNCFFLTIGLFPQNILFVILCAIPLAFFFLGGMFNMMGIIMMLFLGISIMLLIWTNFSQWAYDRFINDKVEGAQKNRGIYEKVKKNDAGAIKKYREQLALSKHNSLNNRPIKPITDDDLKVAELPDIFSRSDLERLRESKQAIYDDHAKYVEEHKNDEEFKLSEEEQTIIEKNEQARAKRIEKAKKELAKRNKRK